MCKLPFEAEECFKDDDGNKCCAKCIKIYMDDKKKKAKKLAHQAPAKAPVPVPTKTTNIIHCDDCTKPLTASILEFNGGNYHLECLVCYSCKIQLKDSKIYREEKGLACEKCKHIVKCMILQFFRLF